MLKAELDAQRPLQYDGQDPNSDSGHSFVCDGYDNANYFHFNWGWAGRYNGYFSINNLDTGANNGEAGAGNGVYTRDQGAIFGIQPVQCSADEPSNLTYTLSGIQNLTLNWTAANGAASYNIYCNGNYVGNSTTNSYSEAAPFGTNVYYVRSVDANDNLSLSSNTVTFYIGYQTPTVDDLTASLSGNNVSLSWTAPEWCYPETPSATLTYGDGNYSGHTVGFNNGSNMYWGHRYLASNLTSYNTKIIYMAAFYANESGAYSIFVYEGTQSGHPKTKVLEQSLQVEKTGWFEFDLSTHIVIDASKDYWVFMYDPAGRSHPATYTPYSGNEGNYYASSPTSQVSTAGNKAFLIKTYVTDGTYTYNLYDGTSQVASNINATNYTVSNVAGDTAHRYILKTNYYGGETEASNMAGLTLGMASLNNLQMAANDKMTITENSKLIVSGTLSNENSANLVLENGAQLIHNTSGVKATVKKNIAAHDAMTGWNFIASPVAESVTPCEENGLLCGNYDLYYYDEPAHYWRNHKAHTNDFIIEHTKGYLYANGEADGTTLRFEGTLTRSDNPVAISNLSHSASTLNGFNLVGNPFSCNATVNTDYYIIDTNNNVVLAETHGEIAPCEGIFVKASETDNYQVTFTKANTNSRSSSPNNCIDLVISQNRSILDRARVRLGEGTNLEKFSFDQNNTQISLWQNGAEYAVAYADSQDEISLNFKAVQDGTYTLGIESNSLDFGYLHLIDNITGTDVDLLVMPSYTFEAKTTDYVSRFKLVFGASQQDSSSTGSESFAYINDGNIVITGANDNATLQIIDVTGHIVRCSDATQCVSTDGIVPGIYVLRLIDGKNAMTQKLVVK